MKDLKQLVKDFSAARKAYHDLSAQAPRIVKDIAIKETQRNFHMQGFVGGGSYQMWKDRKPSTNKAYDRRGKTYKGSVYSSKNPLLRQTGNMYNAIGNDSFISGKLVNIGVNLNQFPGNYPKVLQEGTAYMPARKWIGFSKRLTDRANEDLKRRRGILFSKFRM